MNGTRMPIERGAYGGQDSTIAPELKGAITNTAAITVGASRSGDKGIDGSIGDFRIFDRVISEEEARVVAIWPAVAAAASKRCRAAVGGRERRVEVLLPGAPRSPTTANCRQEFTRQQSSIASIEMRSNTAMVLEERHDSKRHNTSAVPRHVRSAAGARRGRNAIIFAADGDKAAAKSTRPGDVDGRSAPTLCSRA